MCHAAPREVGGETIRELRIGNTSWSSAAQCSAYRGVRTLEATATSRNHPRFPSDKNMGSPGHHWNEDGDYVPSSVVHLSFPFPRVYRVAVLCQRSGEVLKRLFHQYSTSSEQALSHTRQVSSNERLRGCSLAFLVASRVCMALGQKHAGT